MIKPRDERAVIDRSMERPPEEKLIDAAEAAVRIAADQIDLEHFDIGRRIGFARDDVAAKIFDLRGENGFDPVGEFFPDLIRPASVARRCDFPPASPLMKRGASGNCSQRMDAPGGQRLPSSAAGWPTQIVGTAGSMPRSASFAAFDTPSSPGVRWVSATPLTAGTFQRGGALSA